MKEEIHVNGVVVMGWKGVVRSMAAAARAAERDSRRRQRELEANQKHYEKMAILDQAAYDVEVYENYVDRITSVHKEVRPEVDWQPIFSDPQPKEPIQAHGAERFAREELQNYRPGFFAKLFGTAEKKRSRLGKAIETAIRKDEENKKSVLKEYLKEVAEWEEQTSLARTVLDKQPKAFLKALEVFGSFSEIEELGSRLQFRITDDAFVFCTVKVHSKDIIPNQSKSLLQSGRLSEKNIPKGKFFELYQDYVCGVVLRVANEIFAVLPVEEMVVTATDDVLDTKTGHIEEQPIVSAFIPRKTIQNLNMSLIDPSDSMVNFNHQMKFKKTQGFSAVKEVEPPDPSGHRT